MLCFVDIEHDSWLQDNGNWHSHNSYCMDVKLKLEALSGQPCLVQRYMDVTRERLRAWQVNAVLISGNASDWSVYQDDCLEELGAIIREGEWPILGFCGGHQLIAMAHGAPVGPMRHLKPGEPEITTLSAPGFLKEWGYMPVDVVVPDPLLEGLGSAPIFLEVHYCELKEPPEGFEVLASTNDCCIQVLKRKDKPIYGTQFHPEAYTEWPHDQRNSLVNLVYPDGYPHARSDGRTLISNFLGMVTRS